MSDLGARGGDSRCCSASGAVEATAERLRGWLALVVGVGGQASRALRRASVVVCGRGVDLVSGRCGERLEALERGGELGCPGPARLPRSPWNFGDGGPGVIVTQ